MNIKTIILMCLITQVLPNNGLVQLKSSLATSDSPLLMKILQSVDAATSDDHLLEVTLKLLRSLCVCMHETLKAKEEKFYIQNNSLEPNEPSGTDGKVLDLYRKIYNNTCFNLRQELTNRTHKSLLDEETAFLNNTNCGKEERNETKNIYDSRDKFSTVTNPMSSKLEHILFQALIQTKDYHMYRIKRYNLLGKSKLQTKNALQHRIIVILTLHPDAHEISEKSYNVAEEDLNKTLHMKSPIDIDIIDPKHNKKLIENEKIIKRDNFTDCNILSLYKFIVESEQKNLTKVFKFLRKRDTLKIYIEINMGPNHTDYMNVCCNHGTLIPQCNTDIHNDFNSKAEVYFNENKNQGMKSKIVHNNYKRTITKIKNLVKLYEDKLNDTIDRYNSSDKIHQNQQRKEKTNKAEFESTTRQTTKSTIANEVYNQNDIQRLVSDLNDPLQLGEVTRAILLLNDFVSKQTTKKVLKLQQADKNANYEELAQYHVPSTTPVNTTTVIDNNLILNQIRLNNQSIDQSINSLPFYKIKISRTVEHLIKNGKDNEIPGITLPMSAATHEGKNETQENSNLKMDMENFVNNTFTIDLSVTDMAMTDIPTGSKKDAIKSNRKLSSRNYTSAAIRPTKVTFSLSAAEGKTGILTTLFDFGVFDKPMKMLDKNVTDYLTSTSTEKSLPFLGTNLENLFENISLLDKNMVQTEKYQPTQLATVSDNFNIKKENKKYKNTILTTLKPLSSLTTVLYNNWRKIKNKSKSSASKEGNLGPIDVKSTYKEESLKNVKIISTTPASDETRLDRKNKETNNISLNLILDSMKSYRGSLKNYFFQETTTTNHINLNKATLKPTSKMLPVYYAEDETRGRIIKPKGLSSKENLNKVNETPVNNSKQYLLEPIKEGASVVGNIYDITTNNVIPVMEDMSTIKDQQMMGKGSRRSQSTRKNGVLLGSDKNKIKNKILDESLLLVTDLSLNKPIKDYVSVTIETNTGSIPQFQNKVSKYTQNRETYHSPKKLKESLYTTAIRSPLQLLTSTTLTESNESPETELLETNKDIEHVIQRPYRSQTSNVLHNISNTSRQRTQHENLDMGISTLQYITPEISSSTLIEKVLNPHHPEPVLLSSNDTTKNYDIQFSGEVSSNSVKLPVLNEKTASSALELLASKPSENSAMQRTTIVNFQTKPTQKVSNNIKFQNCTFRSQVQVRNTFEINDTSSYDKDLNITYMNLTRKSNVVNSNDDIIRLATILHKLAQSNNKANNTQDIERKNNTTTPIRSVKKKTILLANRTSDGKKLHQMNVTTKVIRTVKNKTIPVVNRTGDGKKLLQMNVTTKPSSTAVNNKNKGNIKHISRIPGALTENLRVDQFQSVYLNSMKSTDERLNIGAMKENISATNILNKIYENSISSAINKNNQLNNNSQSYYISGNKTIEQFNNAIRFRNNLVKLLHVNNGSILKYKTGNKSSKYPIQKNKKLRKVLNNLLKRKKLNKHQRKKLRKMFEHFPKNHINTVENKTNADTTTNHTRTNKLNTTGNGQYVTKTENGISTIPTSHNKANKTNILLKSNSMQTTSTHEIFNTSHKDVTKDTRRNFGTSNNDDYSSNQTEWTSSEFETETVLPIIFMELNMRNTTSNNTVPKTSVGFWGMLNETDEVENSSKGSEDQAKTENMFLMHDLISVQAVRPNVTNNIKLTTIANTNITIPKNTSVSTLSKYKSAKSNAPRVMEILETINDIEQSVDQLLLTINDTTMIKGDLNNTTFITSDSFYKDKNTSTSNMTERTSVRTQNNTLFSTHKLQHNTNEIIPTMNFPINSTEAMHTLQNSLDSVDDLIQELDDVLTEDTKNSTQSFIGTNSTPHNGNNDKATIASYASTMKYEYTTQNLTNKRDQHVNEESYLTPNELTTDSKYLKYTVPLSIITSARINATELKVNKTTSIFPFVSSKEAITVVPTGNFTIKENVQMEYEIATITTTKVYNVASGTNKIDVNINGIDKTGFQIKLNSEKIGKPNPNQATTNSDEQSMQNNENTTENSQILPVKAITYNNVDPIDNAILKHEKSLEANTLTIIPNKKIKEDILKHRSEIEELSDKVKGINTRHTEGPSSTVPMNQNDELTLQMVKVTPDDDVSTDTSKIVTSKGSLHSVSTEITRQPYLRNESFFIRITLSTTENTLNIGDPSKNETLTTRITNITPTEGPSSIIPINHSEEVLSTLQMVKMFRIPKANDDIYNETSEITVSKDSVMGRHVNFSNTVPTEISKKPYNMNKKPLSIQTTLLTTDIINLEDNLSKNEPLPIKAMGTTETELPSSSVSMNQSEVLSPHQLVIISSMSNPNHDISSENSETEISKDIITGYHGDYSNSVSAKITKIPCDLKNKSLSNQTSSLETDIFHPSDLTKKEVLTTYKIYDIFEPTTETLTPGRTSNNKNKKSLFTTRSEEIKSVFLHSNTVRTFPLTAPPTTNIVPVENRSNSTDKDIFKKEYSEKPHILENILSTDSIIEKKSTKAIDVKTNQSFLQISVKGMKTQKDNISDESNFSKSEEKNTRAESVITTDTIKIPNASVIINDSSFFPVVSTTRKNSNVTPHLLVDEDSVIILDTATSEENDADMRSTVNTVISSHRPLENIFTRDKDNSFNENVENGESAVVNNNTTNTSATALSSLTTFMHKAYETEEVTLPYPVSIDTATVSSTNIAIQGKITHNVFNEQTLSENDTIDVIDQYLNIIDVHATNTSLNESETVIIPGSTLPPTVWIFSTIEPIPSVDYTQSTEIHHIEKKYRPNTETASTADYVNVSTTTEKSGVTVSTEKKYALNSILPLSHKELVTSSYNTAYKSLESTVPLESSSTDSLDREAFSKKVVGYENSIESPGESIKNITDISKQEPALVIIPQNVQKLLSEYKTNVFDRSDLKIDDHTNNIKTITTNPLNAETFVNKSNQHMSSTQKIQAILSTWVPVDQKITTPISIEYNSTKTMDIEKINDQLITDGKTTIATLFSESYTDQNNGSLYRNNVSKKENLVESKKITGSYIEITNTTTDKLPKIHDNMKGKIMLSMQQNHDTSLAATLSVVTHMSVEDHTSTDKGTVTERMLELSPHTKNVETLESKINENLTTRPLFSTEKIFTEANAESDSQINNITMQQPNASTFTINTTGTISPFKLRNVSNTSLFLGQNSTTTKHMPKDDDFIDSLNKETFMGTVTQKQIYYNTEPTSFNVLNKEAKVIHKIKHFDVGNDTTLKYRTTNFDGKTTTEGQSLNNATNSYLKHDHKSLMENLKSFENDLLKSTNSPNTLKPLNTTAKILGPNTREKHLNRSIIHKNQTIQVRITNDTENNRSTKDLTNVSKLGVSNTVYESQNQVPNISSNFSMPEYITSHEDLVATTPYHMLIRIQTNRSRTIKNTLEPPTIVNKTLPIKDTKIRKNIIFKMKTDTKAIKLDNKVKSNENIPEKIKSIYYSRDTLESIDRNTSNRLQGNTTSKIKFVVKIHDGTKNISYIHTPELTHVMVTKLKPVNKTNVQELLPVSNDKINYFRSYAHNNESDANIYDENFKSLFSNVDGGKFKGEKSVQIFSSRVYRPHGSRTTATAVTKIIRYNTYQPTTKEDLELLNYDNKPLLKTRIHKKDNDKPHGQSPGFNNSCAVLRNLKNKFSSVMEFMEVLKAANCTEGDEQTNYTKYQSDKDLHLSQEIHSNIQSPDEIKEKMHSIEIDKISNPILEININSPQIGTNGDSPPMIEIKGNPLPIEIKRNLFPVIDVGRHALPMEIIKNPYSPINIHRNSMSMMEIMDSLLSQNNRNALQMEINKNPLQLNEINSNGNLSPPDFNNNIDKNSPIIKIKKNQPPVVNIIRRFPLFMEINRNSPPIEINPNGSTIAINRYFRWKPSVIGNRKYSDMADKFDTKRNAAQIADINSMADMIRNSPSNVDMTRNSPSNVDMNRNSPSNLDMTRNSPSNVDMTRNSPSNVDMTRNSPSNVDMYRNSPSNVGMYRNSPSNINMNRNSPSNVDMIRNSPSNVYMNKDSPSNVDMNRNSPSNVDLNRNSPSNIDMYRNSPLNDDMNRNSPSNVYTFRNSASNIYMYRNSPPNDILNRNSPSIDDMTRNATSHVDGTRDSLSMVDVNRNSPSNADMNRNSPSMVDMYRNSPSNADMNRNLPSNLDMNRNSPSNVDMNRNSPSNLDMTRNSPSNVDMTRNSLSNVDMYRNSPSNVDMTRNSPSNVEMTRNSPSNVDMHRNSPSNVGMYRNSPSNINMNRNSPSNVDMIRNSPSNVYMIRNSPSNVYMNKDSPSNTNMNRNSPSNVDINRNNPSNIDMNRNSASNVDKNINSHSMVDMNALLVDDINRKSVLMIDMSSKFSLKDDKERTSYNMVEMNSQTPSNIDIKRKSLTMADVKRNLPQVNDINKKSPKTADTNGNPPLITDIKDGNRNSPSMPEISKNSPSLVAMRINSQSMFNMNMNSSTIINNNRVLPSIDMDKNSPLVFAMGGNSPAIFDIHRKLPSVFDINRSLPSVFDTNRNSSSVVDINRNSPAGMSRNLQQMVNVDRSSPSVDMNKNSPSPIDMGRILPSLSNMNKNYSPSMVDITKYSASMLEKNRNSPSMLDTHKNSAPTFYMNNSPSMADNDRNVPSVAGINNNSPSMNSILPMDDRKRNSYNMVEMDKNSPAMIDIPRNALTIADVNKDLPQLREIHRNSPTMLDVNRNPSSMADMSMKSPLMGNFNKDSPFMVTDWWLDDMYLKVRLPLPINSNPGMVFPRRHFAKMEEVADLGALFIDDLLDYKEMLDRGELPLERATSREKGQPLCMEQFYRLLGVCRIPEVGRDRLELPQVKHGSEESEELVVVACRNYFYPIPVKAADRGRLTPGEMQAQLLHAMVDAAGAPPAPRIGLLTSMNRDQWARAREQLIKDETNRMNLELISRALCILCLDEAGGDRADTDADTNAMLRAMHGAGTRYHSANRWFDKTVQLIISSDGTVGMCYEHSAAEGVAVVRLAERALARAEVADRPAPPPALLPAPQAMKWNVTTDVQRTIETAARDLDRAISDLDHKVYTYRGYGREFMKSCRTSPDVYIQLAMQYAYYKMYGYLVTTYESASLRRFRNGRVDNIRSAHAAALAWAAAMCTAETSPLNDTGDDGQKKVSFNLYGEHKKLELFEEAARKQTSIMEANILGKGIDNHLLGLREAARETLGELPQVFSDATYKQMIEFKLSTSQVTTTTDGTFMGYGAVCPDGYGCSYNPKKDSVIFCISSFTSSSVTNTEAFRQSLEEALDSMKLMFQARKKEN